MYLITSMSWEICFSFSVDQHILLIYWSSNLSQRSLYYRLQIFGNPLQLQIFYFWHQGYAAGWRRRYFSHLISDETSSAQQKFVAVLICLFLFQRGHCTYERRGRREDQVLQCLNMDRESDPKGRHHISRLNEGCMSGVVFIICLLAFKSFTRFYKPHV